MSACRNGTCGNAQAGEWSVGQCRTCWLVLSGAFKTEDFGKGRRPVTIRTTQRPCRWLGEPTEESVECRTCTGKVTLKLFACAEFGVCTPGKKIEGIACCVDNCPKYLARVTNAGSCSA